MSELTESKCEACRVGAPLLGSEEFEALKTEIPDWEKVVVDGVEQLKRVYVFSNFVTAMNFANAVGVIAESEGHHPALLVEWGRVSVSWWSHKIKGLHKNDVIMAAKTDVVFLQTNSG